ncbi:collectin-11-like isoform X4 [Crassostrea angulata]|uniref:collectin-11-like isoform X4 n=1 Tax=Magallana angulata TaxID=2784310 RepID=UPI0022B17142|nr:collectin-11-like isoform X4 [Crassostrea angulata]
MEANNRIYNTNNRLKISDKPEVKEHFIKQWRIFLRWFSWCVCTFPFLKALCQSFGSKLAEPVTQEEVVFLGRETMQIGNNGDYFIGIHDIFLEGEWMYAYSRKPVTLTMPWASGNPDNYHEEDCVEIDSSPQFHGMWGDALCSYPLYYICEYDSSDYIQAPAVIG